MIKNFLISLLFFSVSSPSALPSFPGAEGWAADTPGGRGGKVLVVTTLNSTGAGSLFEAISTPGPRTIVFAVSGVIRLIPSAFELNGPYSNVTIAGQTSPGGITLTGGMQSDHNTIFFCYDRCNPSKGGENFHDGIFRFLRFRGNVGNEDAVEMNYSHHMIFDHCDFSGGRDETFSLTHSHDYNVQWCTIANSSSGQNSGSLFAYEETKHVTMHHNLWAHHTVRGGPLMHWGSQMPPENGLIDYRNNLSYNIETYAFHQTHAAGPVHINMAGNYIKAGPQSRLTPWFLISHRFDDGHVYDQDNCFEDQLGVKRYNVNDSLGRYEKRVMTPWAMPPVKTTSSEQAYNDVLDWVGAWPRDAMNVRTVNEVKNGTGQFRKDDDPLIQTGPGAPADQDLDGMPDFWETGMGFDPNNAADNMGDHDGDGYTNVEEFINDLALARVCNDYYNQVYPIPADWPDYNPDCSKSVDVEKRPVRQFKALGLRVFPNPWRGNTLTIRGSDKGSRVQIFNASGKTVFRHASKPSLVWDGKDLSGKTVSPGVYLLKIKKPHNRAIFSRIVKMP